MLKTAFRNNAIKKNALYKCKSKFEQGDNSATDEQRRRPPLIRLKKEN